MNKFFLDIKNSLISLANNTFVGNSAYTGGAIHRDSASPYIKLEFNLFNENRANYGPNLASYASRLRLRVLNTENKNEICYDSLMTQQKFEIKNAVSGAKSQFTFQIMLIDPDNESVNFDHQ